MRARATREKVIVRLLARAVLAAGLTSSFQKLLIISVFALVSAECSPSSGTWQPYSDAPDCFHSSGNRCSIPRRRRDRQGPASLG
jgi:hypothetical protein